MLYAVGVVLSMGYCPRGCDTLPQITVTVDDDVYWDLMNLPKGLKSKFVCTALRHVITWKCDNDPGAMYAYARGQPHEAFMAASHPNQSKLGVEEE